MINVCIVIYHHLTQVTKVIMPTPEEVEQYLKDQEDTDEEMEEEDNKKREKEPEGDDDVMVIKEVKAEKTDDNEVEVLEVKTKEKTENKDKKKVEEENYPPFATFKYEVIELEPWDYKERKVLVCV